MAPHGREAVTRLRAPDLGGFVEGRGYDFVPETQKQRWFVLLTEGKHIVHIIAIAVTPVLAGCQARVRSLSVPRFLFNGGSISRRDDSLIIVNSTHEVGLLKETA